MRKTGALSILAALALLALFALRADRFARSASQTFDEGAHLAAGVSYWRTGDFRLNPEHPPLLKLLWAIPVAVRSDVPFQPNETAWGKKDHWLIADAFLYAGPVDHFEMLLAARRVNIALGVMLVALIGWWAYRLWGIPAGLLACGVAAVDPNLAAFAALLSMDLGLALFATTACYAFWEFSRSGSRLWFILTGIAIGLALASKFSAVITLGGLAIAAGGYTIAGRTIGLPGAIAGTPLRARLSSLATVFIRLTLIAAVVVLVCYFGINALDWPAGLKQQLVRGEFGDPHFFLNGEISTTGWWYYFFEVLAIKTPIGTLLLTLLGLISLTHRRPDRREVAFLYGPAAVYFLAMALSKIDIGWRVILPAYPALILLAARATKLVPSTALGRAVFWGAFVAALVPTIIDIRKGRELSFANQRTSLHNYLGDSNLDWGQGLKALKSELASLGDPVVYLSYAGTARPEAYGIRHERLPTWGQFHTPPADRVDPAGPILVAVSVSNLQGTYLNDPTMYRWLLERDPISRTDDSIWVWDLTGDADAIERVRRLARGQ